MSNYGFQPPTEEELKSSQDAGYVLGGVIPKKVIQEDGQWDNFLPAIEIQRDTYETSNCTAYGSTNLVEILFKKLFGEEKNYSERFTGIMAGTRPPGNNPHSVLETIRKKGLIGDSLLPLSGAKTLEEYYTPDPMTSKFKRIGRDWLKNYTIKHEWVFMPSDSLETKKNNLKESLRFSPIGISVYAWLRNGYYVKPANVRDNHWCVLYGYTDDYWKIFDSYDSTHKKLDYDFNFEYAKRVFLSEAYNECFLRKLFNRILFSFTA